MSTQYGMGTTNVLSSEVVRHLVKDDHLEIFGGWLSRSIEALESEELRITLSDSWRNLHRRLTDGQVSFLDALGNGRRIMFSLAWIVMGLLLAADVERDHDEVATEVARRWILNSEGGVGEWLLPDIGRVSSKAQFQSGEERANWDCLLVWGFKLPNINDVGQQVPPRQSKI